MLSGVVAEQHDDRPVDSVPLAGLELVVREHFSGYRSHTLILAALPAAVVLGVYVERDGTVGAAGGFVVIGVLMWFSKV